MKKSSSVIKTDRTLMNKQTIQLSDEVMNDVKKAANIQRRSMDDQAEFWLRLGRLVETSPQFNYEKVREALQGLVNPDDLSVDENELYNIGFLSTFKIDDKNKPKSLDPKKYTADGNFTGIDENGRLWGYDEKGNYGVIPLE